MVVALVFVLGAWCQLMVVSLASAVVDKLTRYRSGVVSTRIVLPIVLYVRVKRLPLRHLPWNRPWYRKSMAVECPC